MKTIINIVLLSLSAWAARADFVFDNFSSLTFSPTTVGTLTNDSFVLTITGDNGAFLSDFDNGSTNGMLLGNNVPASRIASLTLGFSTPITALVLDLDAMHELQEDSITTSDGVWTSYPATLSLNGNTLNSRAPIINPGGSGIDDNLTVVLTFNVPVSSATFTNIGAFVLDTITAVPVARPRLDISTLPGSRALLTWPTNFTGYALERVSSLPATGWEAVTNGVATAGELFSVTIDIEGSQRLFRLRKL